MDKKSLTIIDIAKLAGVSKTTVSRVINNDPTVQEKNRVKVQHVIDQHNFVPSNAAVTLKTGKSGTIGIITPFRMKSFFENEFFQESFRGIREVLMSSDHDMLFSSGKGVESDAILKFIYKNKVDGIILLYSVCDDLNIDILESRHIPYALVGPYNDETHKNIVKYDYDKMFNDIIGYFKEKNIQKIGLYCTNEGLSLTDKYIECFNNSMAYYGLEVNDDYISSSCDDEHSIEEELSQFEQLGCIPDAIISANATITHGIFQYFEGRNKKVPEIFALENSLINKFLGIPYINQDFYLSGKVVATLLLDAIKTPEKAHKIQLDYQVNYK